jgi:starvation-inducible DNA-binding protein
MAHIRSAFPGLLLDEQAAQIFAMTDEIADRAHKIGGTTSRSTGHIARVKHIEDMMRNS